MFDAVGRTGQADGRSHPRLTDPEAGSLDRAEAARRTSSDRWELGSFFPLTSESGRAVFPWSERPHSLWGSGRDALRALVQVGIATDGWRRLLVPSYYCQPVLLSLEQDIEMQVYHYDPRSHTADVSAGPGDAVLTVALFGKRPGVIVHGSAPVIEDQSHDPVPAWGTTCTADYVVASLRKTLPLPDGGVIWSPQDLPVPDEIRPTREHEAAVLAQLGAMALKAVYLKGASGSKGAYLRLRADGETAMAQGPISGISDFSRSRLPTLPSLAWHRSRSSNRDTFQAAMGEDARVQILDVPFAVVLLLGSREERDRVKAALVADGVYPAVLWPLEESVLPGLTDEDRAVAGRILAIHCDQRYDAADMQRAADVLKRALDRPSSAPAEPDRPGPRTKA